MFEYQNDAFSWTLWCEIKIPLFFPRPFPFSLTFPEPDFLTENFLTSPDRIETTEN